MIAFRPRGIDDGLVRWFNLDYVRALRAAQLFVFEECGDEHIGFDRWPDPEIVLMGCRR